MSSTPPVSKDGFSFVHDSFYAETSNQYRHRRATLPELQALFHPGGASSNSGDPVGHWYEAQLLHYGLAPSKNKAVAKTRLLDAVNQGNLVVPQRVAKLEDELKKEWLKKERAAKKAMQSEKAGSDSKLGGTKTANNGKRKRGDDDGAGGRSFNVNVSVHVGSDGRVTTGGVSTPKKPKPSTKDGKASTTPKKTPSKSAETKNSTLSRGGGSARGRGMSTTAKEPPKSPTPRKIQTARRSGGTLSGRGGGKNTTASEPPKSPAPRKIQTARRSGGTLSARGGRTSTTASEPPNQSAPRLIQRARRSGGVSGGRGRGRPTSPKPKREADFEDRINEEAELDGQYYDRDDDDDDGYGNAIAYGDDDDPGLGPLGLIMAYQWDRHDEFTLILCLDGNAVWGAYDFGMYSGILYLPNRPQRSSFDEVPFTWRGRENSEGEMSFGSRNEGWIQFLGNGLIEGEINCYGKARFSGKRIGGNETRAPRDARSMRTEWEGYHQRAYDHESRARWGRGGGW